MPGWTQNYMVRHKNALPSMHPLPLPLSNIPFLWEIFICQFYLNILFLRTHGETKKWNYIDIQICLVSLWNMNCNYSFIFVVIIMSAAMDRYDWHGSEILLTSEFFPDCSIKIWDTRSYAGSIMHSTRTFEITVSNNRVSCHPHPEHIAVTVIITRAHCCLTAADHCYIILGTIKFVDKSVNDNSAHRLDRFDVIASCSEVRHAARRNLTPNWV